MEILRAIVIGIFGLYFGVGATLGSLAMISYFWAIVLGTVCFFSSFTGFATIIGYFIFCLVTAWTMVSGLILRTLLWLPSFIVWYSNGSEPTFLRWMMPGLFAKCGGLGF
jgi:hypothetical protein